jgi:outer membrane protein TolC
MKNITLYGLLVLSLCLAQTVSAQTGRDTSQANLTLQQCIDYALRNQPAVRQANIDEDINERDIGISLSAWLPQINSSGSYQRYLQRTTIGAGTGTSGGTGTGTGTGGTGGTGTGNGGTGTGGTGTGTGIGGVAGGTQQANLALADNVSSLGLQASQVLYNNDVWQASKASRYSRQYYKQNTQSAKIDVVSNVSWILLMVILPGCKETYEMLPHVTPPVLLIR